MKISPDYILDLVGKGYHSCIMTTFSFDFYFFEMNIMRSLRTAGISNISVFVDANILQESLGNLTGNEHRISRMYSLTSIHSEGVFHPKMYLFLGEENGLLIVGSGNLTASGHGKNDEIWGAFNFNAVDFTNSQLISNSWDYIQRLSVNIKGYTNEKIKWIKEYTPWLNSLPSPNQSEFQKLDENNEIAFITNEKSINIFEKTKKFLKYEEIIEITAIAPYFDKEGKALTSIIQTFPNVKINVILDSKNGIIPSGLNAEISNKILFYEWIDCYKLTNIDEKNRKLHAKLIVFSSHEHEFCLFGSANISVAGLGTEKLKSINEEVSVLLKRQGQNLLSDLNIKIEPSKADTLSSFVRADAFTIENTIFNKTKYPIRLNAIDKEHNKITIYSEHEFDVSNLALSLFDAYGLLIDKVNIEQKNDIVYATLSTKIDNALFVQLIDIETNEVKSNKQIIQDIFLLSKTNPNPKNQMLDMIFSKIETGDDTLIPDLLKYISVEDFSSEENKDKRISVNKNLSNQENDKNINDEYLKYDDFTKATNEISEHNLRLLNNTPNRIAEILNLIFNINTKEEQNFQELDDEETDDIDNSSGREEIRTNKAIKKSEFQRRKKCIINFLSRYNKYLEIKVTDVIKSSNNNIDKGYLSLTDISSYLIALYMTIYSAGRKFTIIEIIKNSEGEISEQEKTDYYLYNSGENNLMDNVKGIANEIIGKFLLLSTRGFAKYENDYTKTRLSKSKKEALYFTFYAIFNSNWDKKEQTSKILLFLNSAFYLSDKIEELNDFNGVINKILELTQKAEANKEKENIENSRKSFLNDFKSVYDNYFERLKKFKIDYSLPIENRKSVKSSFDILKGEIIFTSRYGFSCVESTHKENETVMFDLFRPGFLWNEQKENYILDNDKKYKKNLVMK